MSKIYVHLNHPCSEIDVWVLGEQDSEDIARRQGYVPLEELRQMAAENERLQAIVNSFAGQVHAARVDTGVRKP